jgi:hypothetical protein
MSSVSGQSPLSPNDPEYYAPARVREKLSLPQGPGLEPINSPVSFPASLNTQLKNPPSDTLRRPLYPEVAREPDRLAHERDWRGELFSLAARFAAVAGAVTILALLYILMMPASRTTDTASTATESTGSTRTAQPQSAQAQSGQAQSGQADIASKPALAQFKALLATAPASQPATHEQSDQLLQGFMQWRQKDNSTATSR